MVVEQAVAYQELPFLERLVESLGHLAYVKRVFLFGSRVRGDHQQRSDVDLAVEYPKASVHQWQTILDLVEEAPTQLHIDCVRFEAVPSILKQNIIKAGLPLFIQNGAGS